jgi:hypothetical protein
MGITATVRQAKLRPECADRYPTLPARRFGLSQLICARHLPTPEQAIARLESPVARRRWQRGASRNGPSTNWNRPGVTLPKLGPIDLAQIDEPGRQSSGEGAA